MDRRQLLKRGAFFTVVAATGALAACGGDTGPDAGTYRFDQGVASGDPRDTSVVFWTRCVRADGAAETIDVYLEVATSSDFGTVLGHASLTTSADWDNTLRAKITGLPANTPLYYRFVAGRDISPIGKTRTMPAATAAVAQAKFAWFTCQDWSINHWGAMSLLAAEPDLDFIVHVGDYVYETVGASFQVGAAEPAHTALALPDGLPLPSGGKYANTLNDYRYLYRTYRGDARLRTLHQQWPLIAIWDDHEFSDDCWQDHQTYTNANVQQTSRRRNASQAWVEYMPLDFGDVSFDTANAAYDNIRIYRDFQFGNLLHLVMTDERLYRDDHVVPEAAIAQAQGHDPINGSDSVGSRYFVQQPVLAQFEALKTQALGRAPSILGTTQEAWWKTTMTSSSATWKVWGNEVMLNRLWVDLTQLAPPPYNANYVVNCDSWDGYPSHKAELLGYLKANNVQNVVAITGDLHAFQCGVVRDVPDPATGTPVLVDFVTAGISSSSFFKYLQAGAQGTPLASLVANQPTFEGLVGANNPDLKYHDHDAQGYATATVTATQLVVTYNKVKPLNADGTAPAAPLLKRTQMTLAAGSLVPVIADNV
ncbi:alkaline phosphatase D family protein [Scleromatobacter humisilvae]|uniref:Alkaline phosphatase D family protein n=1 Tax=Scleromatobacter humisilvae TaxID=2897159 RepID=A0A9X1YHP8_9BURK|nr:alkaline phosphatase D family protein [Scleromatobacter humisilvae]MCK9685075.1 alkaline phosphatase D family protein [Scleromatobacter humisilvae]